MVRPVRAILWSDYICPWCYLGRDRTALLRELGVEVEHRAFDLHPETPPQGVTVRSGGRLKTVLRRIAVECADVGLPFTMPTRLPRSRRALEVAEVVRVLFPLAFPALDDALFHAVFVDPRDIADADVLDLLVRDAGAPSGEVMARVASGEGSRLLESSIADAREHGITATPSWLVDDRLVIPGPLPREQLTRWIERMARTP
jgi:predicted DsbA family dithiol-disulfide isomerase